MALNTKAIKTRIKSVKNMKKITKAMELVSAAKMRKTVAAALATRTYARLVDELLKRLSNVGGKTPLLEVRPLKKALVIVIGANRGLCGSFNANVFRQAQKLCLATDVPIDILAIGRRSATFAKKYNRPLTAVFENLGDKPTFEATLPVVKMALDGFLKGEYDKVYVVYTHYKSSLAQVPKVAQLLPVSPVDVEAMSMSGEDEEAGSDAFPSGTTLFEPDKKMILDTVLPRLVEMVLYQMVLESAASEHSARMMAMRSASDAAGDMMQELQLSFNKARQAAITQEIAEIAAGAGAI